MWIMNMVGKSSVYDAMYNGTKVASFPSAQTIACILKKGFYVIMEDIQESDVGSCNGVNMCML